MIDKTTNANISHVARARDELHTVVGGNLLRRWTNSLHLAEMIKPVRDPINTVPVRGEPRRELTGPMKADVCPIKRKRLARGHENDS